MSDPRRLKDAGADAAPPGMRELLQAARPTRRMTAPERRRTASRIANLVSVPVAASIAWVWAKGVAIAGVATLSVVTLAHVASDRRTADVPRTWAPATLVATARALGPRFAVRTSPPSPPSPEEAIASPPPEPVATEPAPAPVRAPRRSSLERVAPTSDPRVEDADVLAKEASLLEAARAALTVDPTRALALLDRYGQEFPRGQLAAERNVLRVDALRRLGRVDEAQADGRALLEVGGDSPHPGSDATLYAPRVRKLLDSPPAPERR